MLWTKVSLLAALALPACTIPNDAHCGNQKGDETCAERFGEAMFCDVCVSGNDGCVQSLPEPACRFEEHDTEASASGGATTSPTPSDSSSPSSVGSASASSDATSDDPTTTLSASESDATSSGPTSDDDASTSDATTITSDPESGSTDPTDASSTEPTGDPTDATTGDACLGLGAECDEPEDCCGGLCLPDLVLGIDLCV